MIKITSTNVSVMVKDMDKSIKFYESIGFTIKQRWENHYCMLDAPGLTIGLHPTEGEIVNSTQLSIGMMVESAEEAKALLDKNNIKYSFDDDGKSGIYVHFNDPDGAYLYFTKPNWK